jgi:hypothetical protein
MTILQVFHISPLIRLTLMLLYLGLTLPLPVLAKVTAAPISPWGLSVALGLGGIFLYAILCEQVVVSREGLEVTYPPLLQNRLPQRVRRGWFLAWQDIESLKPRYTSQGGIVYYLVSKAKTAHLLPMRVAGFSQLVDHITEHTGIDTTEVKPLAQPWMYFILLACTLILLAFDGIVLSTAVHLV